jgi:hypothetical protein
VEKKPARLAKPARRNGGHRWRHVGYWTRPTS